MARHHRIVAYGRNGAELRLIAAEPVPQGQRLTLEAFGVARTLVLPLAGTFQAMNVLAAIGLAVGGGLSPVAALDAVASLEGVPGRLQFAGATQDGAAVYVDYAHKPDALATVLKALKPHVAGRLHVLFGCGGDRDIGKRPIMGKIAVEWADRVIVTDDNPRSEDPAAIRKQILAAAPAAVEIAPREDAIREAIADLKAGDVLVIAGKGHERGQIVGDTVLPFDDLGQAQAALRGGAA